MKKKFTLLFVLLPTCMAFGITGTGTSGDPYLVSTAADLATTPVASTFSGTGNWSETERWSDGLPGTTTNVTIDGECTANDNYEVTDLTINSNHSVTVSAGKALTVSGTLTNNAGNSGLVLKSDATGTAMLMNNSTGVHATIEQYLVKDQWHYMGIPVNQITDVDDVFHGCYTFTMHELDFFDSDWNPDTTWTPLAQGDTLKVMCGYAVQYKLPGCNDTTITFSGILNTGIVDTVFFSQMYGWNFVSNPYPVTIDWDASGGKSSTNVNDAIYLWNPDLTGTTTEYGLDKYGSYGSYVSGGSTNGQTQYIAPMQGFFVQVNQVNSSLSFNDNIKKTQSGIMFCNIEDPSLNNIQSLAYKKAPSEELADEPYIKLAVTDNGINFDETIIRENKQSTDLFDENLDAQKLKAIETSLSQLYSISVGKEYSINTIPEITNGTVIPLRLMINKSGTQSLQVKEKLNIPNDSELILYDDKGNVLANISDNDYHFKATKGETKSFYLGFGQISPEVIISLNQSVNTEINLFSQVVIKPVHQGAYIVQTPRDTNSDMSDKSVSIN
ncbi:MAG: hypothetical protein PHH37_15870 [Paludibacter sp.]|nr:hypothetical protein [Paludibacter sp.]